MKVTREIGIGMAIALVMGNMIGSGVFLLPASLAPYGGLSLLGWGVSAAGSVMLALVFARLARANPAAGGPYAYTRQAFGDLPAFLVAWGYWISVWCSTAALAVAFVGYLDLFIPSIVRLPVAAAALAIAMIWLLTLVNILGLRTAGRVQVLTTALKILPLLVIGVAGLLSFAPARFAIAEPDVATFGSHLMATITLTLWAFLGLECATIPAASVVDPGRTIPRATVIGTLLAAALYIVSTAGVMSAVPPATLATTTAPFADAARALFGDTAAAVVAIGAAISSFGALNGWILIVGQLPLAVAEDGLFPRQFARLSSRQTPATGMLIAAVLSTVLVAMNYSQGLVKLFTFMILLSTLSTLVPYTFCALASLVTGRAAGAGSTSLTAPRAQSRGVARPSPGMTIVSALALAYSLVAIVGAGAEAVIWGAVLLVVGVPVFYWMRSSRARVLA